MIPGGNTVYAKKKSSPKTRDVNNNARVDSSDEETQGTVANGLQANVAVRRAVSETPVPTVNPATTTFTVHDDSNPSTSKPSFPGLVVLKVPTIFCPAFFIEDVGSCELHVRSVFIKVYCVPKRNAFQMRKYHMSIPAFCKMTAVHEKGLYYFSLERLRDILRDY